MCELGIEQYAFSVHNPESQGALERFNQTLKNIEAVQETLGFSPFEYLGEQFAVP